MIWPCYDVGKFTIWGHFTPSKNFFLRSLKQLQPNMFLLDKIIVIWNKRVVYKLKLSVVISIWLALSQASLEFKTSIFREVFLPLLLFFDWGFLTQNLPINCQLLCANSNMVDESLKEIWTFLYWHSPKSLAREFPYTPSLVIFQTSPTMISMQANNILSTGRY